MMLNLGRMAFFLLIGLTVVYVSLYFYWRSGIRMRLEEDWVMEGRPGDRDLQRHTLGEGRLEVGQRGGVGVVVGVVDLLLRGQVLQVRLHGGHEGLLTGLGELRDRDGGQDPDDDHDDQQLDEGETLVVPHGVSPVER